MRTPVQDRSRKSAERVLDAALEILSTEGLAALTTSRLAKQSGVSNGSIYHRFGSRQELLSGALQRFTERLGAEVAQLRADAPPPQDLVGAVEQLVQGYQLIFGAYGRVIRSFFIDSVNDSDLAEVGDASKQLFGAQVSDFLHAFRDQIDCQDIEATGLMLHRLLFAFFTLRTVFHEDTGDPAMRRYLKHAVLGVLRPESLLRPGGSSDTTVA